MKIADLQGQDHLMSGGKWVPLDPSDPDPASPWLLVRSRNSKAAQKGRWQGMLKYQQAYRDSAKSGKLVQFEVNDAAEFFEMVACLVAWRHFEDDAGLPLLVNEENRFRLLRLAPVHARVLEVSSERWFTSIEVNPEPQENPLQLTEEEVELDVENLGNGLPGSSTTIDQASPDSNS
jgi:hypothetical protein